MVLFDATMLIRYKQSLYMRHITLHST